MLSAPKWYRGQVVRQRFAKPLFAGSNPVGTSIHAHDSTEIHVFFYTRHIPKNVLLSVNYGLAKIGRHRDKIENAMKIRMKGRLFVADFDGALTLVEKEGAPFTPEYIRLLGILSGRRQDELQAAYDTSVAEIAADPGAYGWEVDGQIVAPAMVDPYLRIMPFARSVLSALPPEVGALTSLGVGRVIDILYKSAYKATLKVPRPEAWRLLEAMAGHPNAFVVTNSDTGAVQGKIRAMNPLTEGVPSWVLTMVERTLGNAKKYLNNVDKMAAAVTPELAGTLASELVIPRLNRPVLTARHLYYALLNELRVAAGLEWADIVVYGDIFELDLALPLALGATVILVAGPYTPDYEIAFLKGHKRGHVVRSMSELLNLLEF